MSEMQDLNYREKPETGIKYDSGKPRWDLLPLKETEEIVKVLTAGAVKYDDENWKKVSDAKNRYFSAAMRHITAWKQGETKDPETELNPLAHAGACLLFLQWFDNNEKGINE